MKPRANRLLIACAALLLLSGAAPAQPRTVTDKAGVQHVVGDTSRVVTVGGAATEIVYALGLGDRVVAVDVSSTYPPEALATKPNVGYIRALSPEGVLAVDPTLIIAMDNAGPPDAVKVLRSASIPFVTVPGAHDPEGIIAAIRFIADIMGVPEKGEELANAVAADFTALEAVRDKIAAPRKATFVLSTSGAAPVVGGAGTTADDMFRLAGVTNAMAAVQGYKPAVDEAMLAAEPDALVLMQDRNHGVTDEALAAMPAFAGTPAAVNKRFLRLDGGYLLGFGPRTPQAARDLAAAVYPELNLPLLPSHSWTAGSAAKPE
ncbi:heme/hemin ABC transporter substrate-binding protein [Ancylobacter sp. G4_0304]|uniref:heme/hemin ABC transporter substrate-binding protein n=1 Tax=Ancylobacter sp. G4_0304 TaxID=3114289 RepID=UPI0039C7196F